MSVESGVETGRAGAVWEVGFSWGPEVGALKGTPRRGGIGSHFFTVPPQAAPKWRMGLFQAGARDWGGDRSGGTRRHLNRRSTWVPPGLGAKDTVLMLRVWT